MNDAGWVRLHRRLRRHPLWGSERFSRGQAWVDLLLDAAHTDHEVVRGGRVIAVPRGAVFTSQSGLAERWSWTRETVGKFLKLLEKQAMIADISAVRGAGIGYTLFRISNYKRFQSNGHAASAISPDISPDVKPTFRRHSEEGSKHGKKQKGVVGFRNSPEARHGWERVLAAIRERPPADQVRFRDTHTAKIVRIMGGIENLFHLNNRDTPDVAVTSARRRFVDLYDDTPKDDFEVRA